MSKIPIALIQTIRSLARAVEHRFRPPGADFDAWLDAYLYLHREPPIGNRSRTIAWSAAEEWPGSIEWYVLDHSVLGVPERRGMFYEIPFADLVRMPAHRRSEGR